MYTEGMNGNTLQGGFIGILAVLVVFAAIIFFIVRTDLFTGQKSGKTMLEVNTSAIQQAKDVKARLEQNGVYSSEEVQ